MIKDIKKKIQDLQLGENFDFTYKEKTYTVNNYHIGVGDGEKHFSISPKEPYSRSMNIENITNKYISLYDFNMMSGRSTYKMSVGDMELV
jgi:hypothetical protein